MFSVNQIIINYLERRMFSVIQIIINYLERRSAAWQFYVEVTADVASCLECAAQLSTKLGSTKGNRENIPTLVMTSDADPDLANTGTGTNLETDQANAGS